MAAGIHSIYCDKCMGRFPVDGYEMHRLTHVLELGRGKTLGERQRQWSRMSFVCWMPICWLPPSTRYARSWTAFPSIHESVANDP